MTLENAILDEKSPSALKSMMAFGLYSVAVVVGAMGGLMALLLAA